MRGWRDRNPERVSAINSRYYRKHAHEWPKRDRVKDKAQKAVYTEVRAGRLVPGSCEVGDGCKGPIQAHHDDYAKPLDIRWLCARHHAYEHAKEATASPAAALR